MRALRTTVLVAAMASGCSLRSFDGFSSEFDAGSKPIEDTLTLDATLLDEGIDTTPAIDTSGDTFVVDSASAFDAFDAFDTFVPAVDVGSPELDGPRLFVIAGSDGPTSSPILKSTVWAAPINGDGSLGAWKARSPLPDAIGFEHQASVVQSGVIYVTGGDQEAAGVSNKVFRGDLTKAGVVSWSTIGALDRPRKAHAAIVYMGNLYVMGGMTSATDTTDTIARATLSGTSSPGAWSVSSISMWYTARYHAVSAVTGPDSLFVFGGKRGSDTWENEIGRYIVSTSTGNVLSRYTQTTAENLGSRAFHTAAAHNGRMYVLGGNSSSTHALSNVDVVEPGSMGILGSFKPVASMPGGRWGHASTVYGGRIYVVGGASSADVPTTDVFIGTFQSGGDIVWQSKPEWKIPEPRAFHTVVAY